MNLPGALVILGAALFLTSGGSCATCPELSKHINLLLKGSKDAYVQNMARYYSHHRTYPDENYIKTCVDESLTDEDRYWLSGLVEKIDNKLLNELCELPKN